MKQVLSIILFSVLAALITSQKTQLSAQTNEVQEMIREKMEQLTQFKSLEIGNSGIAAVRVIPEFYETRDYMPSWINKEQVEDLIRSIVRTKGDGLDPVDYHIQEILRLLSELEKDSVNKIMNQANLDILLTDALLRMVYHFVYGKVDPEALDPNWNILKDIIDIAPVEIVTTILSSPSLYNFIEEQKPQGPFYNALRNSLENYRQIKKNGGWETVTDGSTLRKGDRDTRITEIKKRLMAEGYIEETMADTSRLFDSKLEVALKEFQKFHGLTADGVIGKNTIEALNVPVDDRINQILVNLERARWVMGKLPEKFLIVNIAAFRLYMVEAEKVTWETRVQVGKPYRQTPIFKADMKYIVFNPTWTVPPTILKEDMLPRVQKDPNYLKSKNISVLNNSGQVIDQDNIDWSKYSANNFPFILRQGPGPTNALGRVKFIFPNEHFVFLHDTPSKHLFEKEARTFSSGCIRTENPFELAELLLNDSETWNLSNINNVIESEKTQTVYLQEPLEVLMLYLTVEPDWEGKVFFWNDVYNRDPVILRGLTEKFTIKKRFLEETN